MCRHLAYLGPPRTLGTLVLDPPHSLLRQSYAPKDMRGGGTMNADGFGLAWYPQDHDEPVRYRRACAMWADEAVRGICEHTRSGAVLAAVRSATVGMPVTETAAAPFGSGRWLFSHNGVVPGWPESVEPLAKALPARDLMTLDAPTDSGLLWALVRRRLETGEPPERVLRGLTRDVVQADPRARLNLLLFDGRRIVATAWYHALSVLAGDDFVAVASEPWDDDPRWRPVPDRHIVTAHLGADGPHVQDRPVDDGPAGPAGGAGAR